MRTHHSDDNNLSEMTSFGSNPGDLKARLYLPSIMPPNAPLVVVLHGCTQTATAYDIGTGWSQLAEKNGFAVVYPEQQRANNGNLCFNWFQPGDTGRDLGEAASIRQMIGHLVLSQGIDPKRIFVTGLSAGGAMASVMLSVYPEVFAGGAIIGGLPYGVASTVGEAFERMQGRNAPSVEDLQLKLKSATRNTDRLPKISVWHGTHDQTVKHRNGEQIVQQWQGVHHLGSTPDRTEVVHGHSRKVWVDASGEEVLEIFSIAGMAHGVPLATASETPLGRAGPFMLEAGISSTARTAARWGLATQADVVAAERRVDAAAEADHTMPGKIASMIEQALNRGKSSGVKAGKSSPADTADGIGGVINNALRAAGLLR